MAMGSRRDSARTFSMVEVLEMRQLMSALYVSNSGSDDNSGSINSPLATVQQAIDHAKSGDTITLRGGNYDGGIKIDKAGLTIRSQKGETASISSPTDGGAEVAISIGQDAHRTTLQDLDISGGAYYAIKTESSWDTGEENPHGPSYLKLIGNRIHDSGRDVIKLTPKTDYATITGNEIYNSGRRDGSNAEGIDAVQANYAKFTKNHVHDITTNGVYFKGGSVKTVISGNLVERTGHSGILLGQSSDENWFDTSANPNYYESIDGVVSRNVVRDTEGAGIGAWAALRPKITNNTMVGVARSMFGGLLVQGQEHWIPDSQIVPSTDVTMTGNTVQVSGARPALEIREGGLTGKLALGKNTFYQPDGQVRIADRTRGFEGSLSDWKAQGFDKTSREANPSARINKALKSVGAA